MILLPVDESYFFDYFSILEIKFDKNHNDLVLSSQLLDSININKVYLNSQISEYKTQEILNSEEYNNLKNINQELFNLIDECKIQFISSVEIDKLNYKRWEAKKILQERFFKNNPITEQKIGY